MNGLTAIIIVWLFAYIPHTSEGEGVTTAAVSLSACVLPAGGSTAGPTGMAAAAAGRRRQNEAQEEAIE